MARFREVEPDEGDLDMVQAVLDYVQVQHKGRDLRIGLLGLDSDNNLCYLDGRVEYDKDEDTEYKPAVQYCGFAKNFLSRSKGPYKPRRRRKPQEPPAASCTQLAIDNHAKRASKLLEEEEKSKAKAEKKRLKKLRQREKRRLVKLEKEKQNAIKDVEDTCAELEGVNGESIKAKGGDKGERGTSRDSDSSDSSSSSDKDSSEDEESDRESISSNSEEELDLSSSFVSKAAVIAKRQHMPKSAKMPERRNSPPTAPVPAPAPTSQPKEKPNAGYNELKKNSDSPSSEDVVKISTDLAVMGNKFAGAGHFDMAVKYFTDAIKYNPKEYKLFGNRSFCFERMQEYERALTDAELSLNMCPGWVKGLYRKGRALAGLQRYDEAAQAFKEVLQLDSSCADAAQELMRVQITQLMEFGFSREQSSNALIIHGTVKKALEALSKISGVPVLKNGSYPTANTAVPARAVSSSRPSNISSLPPRFQAQAAQAAQAPKLHQTQAQNTPKTQTTSKTQTQAKPMPKQSNSLAKTKPDKPEALPELFPLWVGNMVQTVTESMLQNLFSSVGEVHSVKLLRSKRCAFVNFTNQQHCDDAIHKFHGHELHEARITVRYPDRIPDHLGISKSAHQAVDLPGNSSTRECFFWRNMGCSRRPACPFKHILDNKGIDLRKTPEE